MLNLLGLPFGVFFALLPPPAPRYALAAIRCPFVADNSHCVLTANFAIDTFGASVRPEISLIVIACTVVFILVMILATFVVWWHRRQNKQKED